MPAEDKPMVESLDVDNYATWSIRMRALLISKGLWAAVESNTPNGDQDQKALAKIILSVKDHHLATVGTCATAKEAWETLKATYEAKSNARKLMLRRELTQLKMKPAEPLTVYAARAKDLQAQLGSAGDQVRDQEIALQFLAGLPPAFSMISTVLTSGDRELKIEEMLPKLLPVEQLAQPERPEEAALFAKRRNGNGFPGHGRNNGSPGKQGRETRTCFYCGKKGHISRDCRKKKSDEAGSKSSQQRPQFSALALAACSSAAGHSTNDSQQVRWVLDTGASRHITGNRSIMSNLRPVEEPVTITFGNGGTGQAAATGEVLLHTADNEFLLTDVLYIPEASENLISVRHATRYGLDFKFCHDRCAIGRDGRTVAIAPCAGDAIYYLSGWSQVQQEAAQTALAAKAAKETPELWHKRFGHLGYENLARLTSMVSGMSITADEFREAGEAESFCEPCATGKQHRQPFQASQHAAMQPLELVHTDVCGPLPVTSLGGSSYFVTLLDDYSKLSAVLPLARKSDTAAAVQRTLTQLETQTGYRTKRLRCDNGTEYINAQLKGYCDDRGIKLETTVRYTPEQNGAAERLNRTLMDKVRPMLTDSGLPKTLWAEAVVAASYVRNRSPVSKRDKTPWEHFFGQKPDVSHLRTFGARVYALTPKELRGKLDPTSEAGRFIGYPANTKGYKVLLDNGRIVISRDVKFLEVSGKATASKPKEHSPDDSSDDEEAEFYRGEGSPAEQATAMDHDAADAPGPSGSRGRPTSNRPGVRPRRTAVEVPASVWRDEGYMITGRKRNLAGSAHSAVIMEPATMEEALSCEEAELWQQAMDEAVFSFRSQAAQRAYSAHPTVPGLLHAYTAAQQRLQQHEAAAAGKRAAAASVLWHCYGEQPTKWFHSLGRKVMLHQPIPAVFDPLDREAPAADMSSPAGIATALQHASSFFSTDSAGGLFRLVPTDPAAQAQLLEAVDKQLSEASAKRTLGPKEDGSLTTGEVEKVFPALPRVCAVSGVLFPPPQAPIRHLGIFLSTDPAAGHAKSFAGLLHGVRETAALWRQHHLSWLGRAYVAKQVLASKVTYHATFVPPEASMWARITHVISAFVAGSGVDGDGAGGGGISHPAQHVCSLPWEEGGVALVDPSIQAECLQAKVLNERLCYNRQVLAGGQPLQPRHFPALAEAGTWTVQQLAALVHPQQPLPPPLQLVWDCLPADWRATALQPWQPEWELCAVAGLVRQVESGKLYSVCAANGGMEEALDAALPLGALLARTPQRAASLPLLLSGAYSSASRISESFHQRALLSEPQF
ncbi:hypothetical protein N2152v2_002410 [Parachlorella kessleri]